MTQDLTFISRSSYSTGSLFLSSTLIIIRTSNSKKNVLISIHRMQRTISKDSRAGAEMKSGVLSHELWLSDR